MVGAAGVVGVLGMKEQEVEDSRSGLGGMELKASTERSPSIDPHSCSWQHLRHLGAHDHRLLAACGPSQTLGLLNL